jgi:arylsulfatase
MRWPAAGIAAGTECDVLAAHIDIFPTLTAISGAELPSSAKNQADGHNLLPLLKNPKAERPERTLIHHVGRWEKGRAADAKYSGCSIQNSQFTLVNNTELYDLKKDPGETTNVIAEHPQVAEALRAEYDQWWEKVQPYMVNETAVGPKFNPLKEIYWKQFGVAPREEDLKNMNPAPSQKSH